MGDRARKCFEDEVAPGRFLVGTISYQESGTSLAFGEHSERGYYLSVTPWFEDAQGFRTWVMFTGLKALLAPANRFNRKVLDSLVPPADLVEKVKARVLEKDGGKIEVAAKVA